MSDRVRPIPSPARFGLTEQHAEGLLRAAGWWGVDGPPAAVEPVLTALSRSADPD
jgi:glutamate-ammonia-ligase adenylyltransferase